MSDDTTRPAAPTDAAQMARPEERRACNACDWRGPISATLTLSDHAGGGVGPLCPECHEMTDVSPAAPAAPQDPAAIIEAVEMAVGMGIACWDEIRPAEIVRAFREVLQPAPAALADALRQCVDALEAVHAHCFVPFPHAETTALALAAARAALAGAQTPAKKPPLGLRPREFAQVTSATERIAEICAAIARYAEAGEPSPPEWMAELRGLVAAPDALAGAQPQEPATAATTALARFGQAVLSREAAFARRMRRPYSSAESLAAASAALGEAQREEDAARAALAGAQPQEPAQEQSPPDLLYLIRHYMPTDVRGKALDAYRAREAELDAAIERARSGDAQEPVREPSDEEIARMWGDATDAAGHRAIVSEMVRAFARAVRAWKHEESGRG